MNAVDPVEEVREARARLTAEHGGTIEGYFDFARGLAEEAKAAGELFSGPNPPPFSAPLFGPLGGANPGLDLLSSARDERLAAEEAALPEARNSVAELKARLTQIQWGAYVKAINEATGAAWDDDPIMQEIYAAKRAISEEMKHLTPEEQAAQREEIIDSWRAAGGRVADLQPEPRS